MKRSSLAEWVQPGPLPPAQALFRLALRQGLRLRALATPGYVAPSTAELAAIEAALVQAGLPPADYPIDAAHFRDFTERFDFGAAYAQGYPEGVLIEKQLEHFCAWDLLSLKDPARQPYLDIAAATSPWSAMLQAAGIDAWGIDLVAPTATHAFCADATRSPFRDASIGSASLQCAFEMFAGDSDIRLIRELGRILRDGGRCVIAPLYMHTHACHYQTPEYLGRFAGDAGARTYVRRELWGVPSSRKYSASSLLERIVPAAREAGLHLQLRRASHARSLHPEVYLHFILVLDKLPSSKDCR